MNLNITDAIFERADQFPHQTAVIDPEMVIDYRTLCRMVRCAAQMFAAKGWRSGDRVGISIRDSATLNLVIALALARMGVTQLALPAGDPVTLRTSRMARVSAVRLVTDHQWLPAGSAIESVMLSKQWLTDAAGGADGQDARGGGDHGHWIINETSGTTASPKLIGVSHVAEDIHRRIVAPIFSHRPGERFLNLTPMRFLTALKRAICCLSDGGTITLAPSGLGTDKLLQWIDQHDVTYLSCVPVHLHRLLRDIRSESPRLPSLRILRSSSAALTESAAREIRQRLSANLCINYGVSEAGPIVAADAATLAAHPDTVGYALEGVDLQIVNSEDHVVADGVPGHVRVRGAGIETSYLDAEDGDSQRVFRNGWCYPGDLAIRNTSGLVFLKGRSDEVMNFGGIMVGPHEIESVLRQYPSISEVAAFALPSPEHQDMPAAALVSGQTIDLGDLSRFCNERLGIRAPRIFFNVPEIPKNPIGKVLRRRLAELAMEKFAKQSASTE